MVRPVVFWAVPARWICRGADACCAGAALPGRGVDRAGLALRRPGGLLPAGRLGGAAALALGKFGVVVDVVGGLGALGAVQVQVAHLRAGRGPGLLPGHPRELLAAAHAGRFGVGAGAGAGFLQAGVRIGRGRAAGVDAALAAGSVAAGWY